MHKKIIFNTIESKNYTNSLIFTIVVYAKC